MRDTRKKTKIPSLHRAPNIMKRVMRCHDFGSGREASRSPYLEYGQGERQSHGPKLVPAPGISLDNPMSTPGLRPKSATRRSVEQGSAQRGAGTRLRDATVEPIVGASSNADPTRVSGVRSPRGPSSALRRARLRGCDRAGACESRALRRSHVPLRGRIQAHDAWNLLRPARATLLAGLAIYSICPAPSFASAPILARNAHVFHYVRGS